MRYINAGAGVLVAAAVIAIPAVAIADDSRTRASGATASTSVSTTTATATAAGTTDVDCSDFASLELAQAELARDASDPHDLDVNNNRTACETVAGGLAEDGTAVPGSTTPTTTTTATSTATASTVASTTSTTASAASSTTATASARDLNCSDFATQADAQAELLRNSSDPHDLDRDNDGMACEAGAGGLAEDSTALRGSTTAPTTTTTASSTTASTTATAATTTASSTTTAAPTSQVVVRPKGGVGAGDGSTADGGRSEIPYAIGVVALMGAGGAAVASWRSSRPRA
jgi:hypothetical protein